MAIVIGMVIGGLIGMAIGKGKGHGGLGFILGMFLGLIGWIIVGVMKPANAEVPQVGFAPAYGAPQCRGCGQHGRWIADSSGWGCDRCKQMIAA